jgi:hypothetical protein
VPRVLCRLESSGHALCVCSVLRNHWSEGRISKTDGSDAVSTLYNNDNVLLRIVLHYVFLL